jgi:hypothetical protein
MGHGNVLLQAVRVGLIGEPPDAMAGVLVDPGLRRGSLCSLGGDGNGWQEDKAGNGREKSAQHGDELLWQGIPTLRAGDFWMNSSPGSGAPENYTPWRLRLKIIYLLNFAECSRGLCGDL